VDILQTALMGLIQGLTEFLPVSSSGHLVIMQKLFGGYAAEDMFLNLALHIGTLAAVLIYFRQELMMLIRATFSIYRKPKNEQEKLERRLLFAVLIASVPTAIIGLLMDKYVAAWFGNFWLLGSAFAVTTVLLILSRKFANGKTEDYPPLVALIVGISQGLAVIPGISRAGTTIVIGQMLGLQRNLATRFAFVISIPAILGATLLHLLDTDSLPAISANWLLSMLCGMIVAAITGYVSLIVLTKLIEKARFHHFAFYTATVSVVCIVLAIVA
jgi:undecaprenyl-diphosphatase